MGELNANENKSTSTIESETVESDDEINTEGSTFINKDVVYESYDEKSESTRGEYEIVTEGSSSSAESESEDDSHHENAKYRTNYERDNEGSTEPKIVNESYDENAREIKDQG